MTRSAKGPRPDNQMFGKVRRRLTLFTVMLVMALYVVSSVVFYAIVRKTVVNNIDSRLVAQVKQGAVRRALTGGKPIPNASFLLHTQRRTVQDMPSGVLSVVQTLVRRRPLLSRHQWSRTIQGVPYQIIVEPLNGQAGSAAGYWAAAVDVSREYAVLDRVQQVLLYVGIGGLLVSAMIGFYLAEHSLRPIRLAWKRQSEFASDASHELRTPLAVIQTNLSVVMEHPEETVLDNLEWLNTAQSELRRLKKMVDDLLTLARSGADAVRLNLQRVDMAEVVAHVVELFDGIAAQKNIALSLEADPLGYAVVDRDRIHQLLVILIDNAIKYTPQDGSVQVRAKRLRQALEIEVQDTGAGIAENELGRVFQRFYRSPATRGQSSAGFGLGLPIAQWIAEAHGGKIGANSHLGQGTTMRVQLPLSR